MNYLTATVLDNFVNYCTTLLLLLLLLLILLFYPFVLLDCFLPKYLLKIQ